MAERREERGGHEILALDFPGIFRGFTLIFSHPRPSPSHNRTHFPRLPLGQNEGDWQQIPRQKENIAHTRAIIGFQNS
jgi:hypothetical protein